MGDETMDHESATPTADTKMAFFDAVKICFAKYADFSGRAPRAEYWWFYLFFVLGYLATSVVSGVLGALFAISLLLPDLAATVRRLHDTNRSAWHLLWNLLPFIGMIVLLVFLCQESKNEGNRF